MLITGIIVVALIFIIVLLYNKIITNHNRAKRAWSDVITYEKLKQDVIPHLTEVAETFKEFEQGFMTKITALRESLAGLDKNNIDVNALADVEQKSQALFSSFKAVAEDYPELASTEIVSQLMDEISDKNDNVAAAITIFNRAVEKFNNSIEMVPFNLVNSFFARKQKLSNFDHKNVMQDYDYKPNF